MGRGVRLKHFKNGSVCVYNCWSIFHFDGERSAISVSSSKAGFLYFGYTFPSSAIYLPHSSLFGLYLPFPTYSAYIDPFPRSIRLILSPSTYLDYIRPYLGLTGPKIRQHNSAIFCFVLFVCYFFVFWGFNCSKMANFYFRTYSNSFWIIYGTSKKVTKYGPPPPYLLQKYYKTYKKILWNH